MTADVTKEVPGRLKRLKAGTVALLRALRQDLVVFCNETTLHGLGHIVARNRHPVERIFWALTFCAVAYSAGMLCSSQLRRYTTNPTVVSIKKDFRRWSTTFPAITACLSDHVDQNLVEAYILKKWNVSFEDPEKFEYYSSFIQLVASVSFRTNLRLFWKYEHDDTLLGMDLMGVAVAVAPVGILRVALPPPAKPREWVPVMTEMGICRTFNSVFSRYQSVETWARQLKKANAFSQELPEKDLISCHYMNSQCYARFSIVNSTGVYYVHSPWELAETTTLSLGPVMTGQEVEAQLRAIQVRAGPGVRRLTVKQRSCRYPDEPLSDAIPAYSNALCQIDCRSRMAIVFCGCRPFFYIIGNGKACDAKGMACLGRSMEILVNLPTNLAKCQCVPQCTEVNYILHDTALNTWNTTQSSVFDRRSSVRLALQMPKVLYNKVVIFTFADLVASFGGVGALFLGVSFISVVEILLCLLKPAIRLLSLRSGRHSDRVPSP